MARYRFGLTVIFAALFVMAAREVYFGSIIKDISIYSLLFYSSILTTVFFTVLRAPKARESVALAKSHLPTVIKMNLTTAVMWVSYLFGMQFIDPASAISITSAVEPMSVMIISALIFKKLDATRVEYLASVGVLGSIGLISYTLLLTKSGNATAAQLIAGIAGCLVSGVVSSWNCLYAEKLGQSGVPATVVMATRFFGLTIMCAAIMAYKGISFSLTSAQALSIVVASGIGIILPLYLLQVGMTYADATICLLLMTFEPVLAFALQMTTGEYPFSVGVLVGIIMACLFLSLGTVSRLRNHAAEVLGT